MNEFFPKSELNAAIAAGIDRVEAEIQKEKPCFVFNQEIRKVLVENIFEEMDFYVTEKYRCRNSPLAKWAASLSGKKVN